MMCINCGSTRIEVDERSWGEIYECQSCGHEDTMIGYGYYPAPEVERTVAWVLERWDAEVKDRPQRNVYWAMLNNTWRAVYRHLTGEEMPRPDEVGKDDHSEG